MTILHIITRLILGGAQQNTVMSCAHQVAAGHRVVLAYGPIYGPEGSLLAEAEASGAELVELKHMVRSLHPWHDPISYMELKRLIRRVQPDVVHTHSSKAGITGRGAAWACRGKGGLADGLPKVVHTVHGLAFHDKQSNFVHGLYVKLERWAAKRCDHLIAITPAMVEGFVDEQIAAADRFTVIPSGVDLSRFDLGGRSVDEAKAAARAKLGLTNDEDVVGIVARLDPLKGHDDLLVMLQQMKASGRRVTLLVIGDGWHRETLVARSEELGVADQVRWLGLVPHEELVEVLPACDLKILPSYQEGQSRTLIEALLCGCGIVAYNVGGMPAICREGETGRLVESGDVAGLTRVVGELLDDGEQVVRLNAAGQRWVRERYDSRVMCEQLLGLYEELVTGPLPGPLPEGEGGG